MSCIRPVQRHETAMVPRSKIRQSLSRPEWDQERRGHSKKLFKRSRLDIRKHVLFFSHRIVDKWNVLRDSCMQCTTLNDLKTKIKLQLEPETLNRMHCL